MSDAAAYRSMIYFYDGPLPSPCPSFTICVNTTFTFSFLGYPVSHGGVSAEPLFCFLFRFLEDER